MTAQNDPNPLSDRLLDALLTPETGGETASQIVGSEPAAARERDRLVAFLKAAGAAHEAVLDSAAFDPRAVERVVARVTHRVHDEEDRLDREAARPRWWAPGPLWARVFAASAAVHAAVIVVLAVTMHSSQRPAAEPTDDPYAPVVLPSGDGPDEVVFNVPEDPLPAPTSPYASGLADLPIGVVLAKLPDGDSNRGLEPTDPAALRRYFPSVARSMWLRSEAGSDARAEIYRRLGVPALATRAKPSLDALAAHQAADGSFEPMPGHGRVQATATVLLAFESEGHASRAGAHRAVVENGVRFLRRETGLDEPSTGKGSSVGKAAGSGDAAADAWALLALTEDVMLSSGALTPAETRARAAEVRRLADVVASRPNGGMIASLATASASRLRSGPSNARGWNEGTLASASAGPEALQGTAMLLSGRAAEFTTWVGTVLPRLDAKFALDGLVRSSSPTARVEETALALLALQVPVRTY